jgi:hypothetical protein
MATPSMTILTGGIANLWSFLFYCLLFCLISIIDYYELLKIFSPL